jgi:outer membrane lipoprotein SlyB
MHIRAVLLAAGVAMLGASPLAAQASPQHQQNCSSCGTVVSSHTYERKAESGSGLGVAGGAVVGGLLGNQVGGGRGRTLATVAGAVGGGYAGNEIEKNARAKTYTDVRVRMSNGAVRTFTEQGATNHYKGEKVRVVNGHLAPRN